MLVSYKEIVLVLSWLFFCVAHLLFMKLFLYWHLAWLDTLMHLWGGALLVATWYQLKANHLFLTYLSKSLFQPLTLLITFIISWEIFKYLIGSTIGENYAFDTMLDVVAGFSGGLITFFYNERHSVQ